MSVFRKAQCGCIYIPGVMEHVTVQKCWDDNHDRHHLTPNYTTISDQDILVSESEQEKLLDELNRLIALGRKMEQVRGILGIEVKP